jgi:hypothetical protein
MASDMQPFNTMQIMKVLARLDHGYGNKLDALSTVMAEIFNRSDAAANPKEDRNQDQITLMNAKLGSLSSEVAAEIAQSPKNDLNTIKIFLASTADSPKRQEIVKTISNIDPKIISLNVTGENLIAKSKSMILDFQSLVKRATDEKKAIDTYPEFKTLRNRHLELVTTTEPFLEDMAKAHAQVFKIKTDTEQLTGNSFKLPSQNPEIPSLHS